MEQYISFALGAGLVMVIVATVIIVKALLRVNTNKAKLNSLEEYVAEINRNMDSEMDSIKDEVHHHSIEAKKTARSC